MSHKTQERIVTRNAFVRDISEEMKENREVEFVISSEAVDSYNTVFRIDGWELSDYEKNPIVCYQHRASSDDPDNIIGTSTLRVEDGKLIGTVRFEDAETNPKAEKVFRKVLNGTLKMASVGARVLKARLGDEAKGEDKDVLYFTRQKLFEWSVVSIGSNPDAHKRNEITLKEMIEEVSKTETPIEIQVSKKSVREAQLIINKNRS